MQHHITTDNSKKTLDKIKKILENDNEVEPMARVKQKKKKYK